jgi:fructose/tagatose bisphosphate aldolase
MSGFETVTDLLDQTSDCLRLDGETLIIDDARFRAEAVDRLAYSAVFGDQDVRDVARWVIWQAGQELGAYPASIHDYYLAGGQGAWKNQTTPAINVRGMAYDMARAVVRAAQRLDAKQFIFEIARSEMGYANQRPEEFATVMIAAALREGYTGPLFIQGDHFQINAAGYAVDPEAEVQAVKTLIDEAIEAGFYNIDVDSSTLVDLRKSSEAEQQILNYERCAELTEFIRQRQPDEVMISIGGEIGEVGLENSTVEDLHAFMAGYVRSLAERGPNLVGISKISVQTGTSHGGTVLPDGTIADVSVDFATLAALSSSARSAYGMAGAVQHGASTLPEIAFNRFAESNACEVHLATGFQNIIYDSPAFPEDLRREIYAYIDRYHRGERKPGMSDAQFYYITRKRGFGPFKRAFWSLPEESRQAIGQELEDRFCLIFERLNVGGTADLVEQYVSPVEITKPAPAILERAT